jgi:hypothetical protein
MPAKTDKNTPQNVACQIPVRWSEDRIAIQNLEKKKKLVFPAEKYHNIKSKVAQLNHAFYGKKEWHASKERGAESFIVKRIK